MEFRQEKRLVIFKKIVIQIVALISALVLLAVPASATEYGLDWRLYLGTGSGSVNPGGVFFYTYNSSEGKYHYYPTVHQFNGVWMRGLSIDKKYNTVAAIFNQPVDVNEFQRIFDGPANQKFYIEFPVYVEFGDDGGIFDGNFEAYLSTLYLMVDENGNSAKYTVDLNVSGIKWYEDVAGKGFTVGFVITPKKPILDIQNVSFNFEVSRQTDNYYIQVAPSPSKSIIVKTGDDIPVNAPSAEKVAGDIMDSIPVDNDGLVNALENFGGAMMHNTTECSWKVPSIMFPKIEGVSDGTAQLVPEMDIDFEEYAGLIPEDIMTLIQALTTVALIGYCIYELYGMIEYVMTMRKGGGSE